MNFAWRQVGSLHAGAKIRGTRESPLEAGNQDFVRARTYSCLVVNIQGEDHAVALVLGFRSQIPGTSYP